MLDGIINQLTEICIGGAFPGYFKTRNLRLWCAKLVVGKWKTSVFAEMWDFLQNFIMFKLISREKDWREISHILLVYAGIQLLNKINMS